MKPKYGIQIKWLSVTCFEITDGNVTIVSDPCVTESPLCPLTWEDIEKCDCPANCIMKESDRYQIAKNAVLQGEK